MLLLWRAQSQYASSWGLSNPYTSLNTRGIRPSSEDPPVNKSPIISSPPFVIKVQIFYLEKSYLLTAVIDSGSAGNFMNFAATKRLKLPLGALNKPPRLSTIDGGPIGEGTIRCCTPTHLLRMSSLHTENATFLLTNTPKHPIILGSM